MFILGISCYYHDAAAALIHDGHLIAASAEERFSRIKHDSSFPIQAIQFCLKQAGISSQDLDYVVFYEKPLLKFERILVNTLRTFPRGRGQWHESMLAWFKEKLWIKAVIRRQLDIPESRVLFCEHHLSHAASAFFACPFREAAVLTVDGVGEWATTTLGTAAGMWLGENVGQNRIDLFSEQRFPHSLGLLYSTFTAFLGFTVNDGEYKVMGMAPYGTPRYMDKVARLFHQNSETAAYELNLDYFGFTHALDYSFTTRFLDVFGAPRMSSDDFITRSTSTERSGRQTALERNQYYADIAASIQRVTEDTLINTANYLHKVTGLPNLVMAGGVALNTSANYRLRTETPFKRIFIQPAAGDDGGALGAALWAYHIVLQKPRVWTFDHAYWGQSYTEEACRTFLDEHGIQYRQFKPEKLAEYIADGLVDGKVVGLFQGRAEWGPRALGNRSILADPRSSQMKDLVNLKIKFREPFRPFAPAVLNERAAEYFAYPDVTSDSNVRYMLMVSPIHEHKQHEIASVCHVDGTGRLQTIDHATNQLYYEIIQAFGERTGVPVLLNTSFNLRGEPIANSPHDAWLTFIRSDLDILVLESMVVEKFK